MQKGSHTISSNEYLRSIFNQVAAAVKDHGFVKLEWSAGSNRSLSQNALYWAWMGELAVSFTNRAKDGSAWTKDDMHDLMRHQFLGYEEKVIGKTELKPTLKSTADLDRGEMHYFMEQIDAWGAEHGVMLPHPADSEYMKLMERQTR